MSKLCFALDLSAPKGSFCVFEDSVSSHLILEKELPGVFTHSESFLNELKSALSHHGLSFSDITKWITSSGPGSFTGLRIAYATLKAFALATSKPVLTLEGPEARATAFYEEMDPKRQIQHLDVLSYLTADKFVVSSFDLIGTTIKKTTEKIFQGGSFKGEPGGVVLTEERMLSSGSNQSSAKTVLFPLRSRHLRFFQTAASRRDYQEEEIPGLSPLYFGSSHFD